MNNGIHIIYQEGGITQEYDGMTFVITGVFENYQRKEIEDGIIPDPSIPVDPMTGMPMDPNAPMGDLGKPVMEPNTDGVKGGGATEADGRAAELDTSITRMPKGGQI